MTLLGPSEVIIRWCVLEVFSTFLWWFLEAEPETRGSLKLGEDALFSFAFISWLCRVDATGIVPIVSSIFRKGWVSTRDYDLACTFPRPIIRFSCSLAPFSGESMLVAAVASCMRHLS